MMPPFKTAETIGLAMHELTTNALRHGALKVSEATRSVSWTVAPGSDGRPWLTIGWVQQGVPDVPADPTRKGFGRELIEGLCPISSAAGPVAQSPSRWW